MRSRLSADMKLLAPDMTVSKSLNICGQEKIICTVEAQLAEYFEGNRKTFTIPLDLRCFKNRKGRVQQGLQKIPYGHMVSYSQFAEQVDDCRVVRFVATAVAQNPLPIIYPCHRIIKADGSFGNYQSGQRLKELLLKIESQK